MHLSIRQRFNNLSLTSQALLLITSTIVFLFSFFFFFLNDNLNRSISQQMFEVLELSQQPVLSSFDKHDTLRFQEELLENMNEANITTDVFFFDQGKGELLLDLDQAQMEPAMQKRMEEKAQQLLKEKSGLLQEKIQLGKQTWYSRMVVLDGGPGPAVLFSFMDDQYARELSTSMLYNIVFLISMAFIIVLLVFLWWVFSIIHPLNQIRAYITKIKEDKEALLNIDRKDEIGEVADELKNLREELERQEKVKEEMIHNISHDLKTPIATIQSYGESIKDGIYPYGDLDSSVDVILDNASRLQRKVHNLLYMNRVEYLLASNPESEKTELRPIVEEVVHNAALAKPEVKIDYQVEPGLYYDGLAESWRVCLENILDNALRYARSRVLIEADEQTLSIYNDGPAIDEKELNSLFLPYRTGKGGKFGLGLSIVKKITNNNGYKVSARNCQDGVIFEIVSKNPAKKPRKQAAVFSSLSKIASRNSQKTEAKNQNKNTAKKGRQKNAGKENSPKQRTRKKRS